MKKLVSMLLALLIAALYTVALAAPGDAVVARRDEVNYEDGFTDYIRGSDVSGDTLFLIGNDGIYTYKVGEADVTLYAFMSGYSFGVSDDDEEMKKLVGDDYSYAEVAVFYADGGRAYALLANNTYINDSYTLNKKGYLVEYTLENGEAIGKVVKTGIDLSLLIEDYGDWSYLRSTENAFTLNGVMYARTYDGTGNNVIYAFDPQAGTIRYLNSVRDIQLATPYKDGQILIEMYNYNQPQKARFYAFDPVAEASTLLAEVETVNESAYDGVAYSEETGLVYYASKGMLMSMDLQTGKTVEVSDIPVSVYGDCAKILSGTHYVCTSYDGTCVRNLDPALKSDAFLKVYNGSYASVVNSAYYSFSNINGSITPVVYSTYTADTQILENMMNRVAEPDIYCLSVQSQAYSAIRSRGYMADFNGSKTLCELVDAMYPAFRDEFISNGDHVAIPVELYGYCLGFNTEALTRLGLTADDIPTNWSDLLNWFADGLPALMSEDDTVSLCWRDETADECRYELFGMIMSSYIEYLDNVGWEKGFNTPELRSLLEKLDRIDFTVLGQPEESPYDENGNYISPRPASGMYVENAVSLLDGYSGFALGYMYSGSTPVPMAISPDSPRLMPVTMYVAFINPFTKHYDEAVQFLECVAGCLDARILMNLRDDMNDPVPNKHYEENLESAMTWLDEITAQLETAEPSEKQSLEEQLEWAKQNVEWAENNRYDISPEQIAWYRANAECLQVEQYNPLYSGESSDELYETIEKYRQRTITSAELLQRIDKTLRMMILEGM